MGFGDRLKFARKAKGMSGAALGAVVGVERATISHWEVERYVPDLRQLVALSKAVGVNLHWLATGDVGVLLSEDEHKLIQAYRQQPPQPEITPAPAPVGGPAQTVTPIGQQESSWKRRQTGKEREAREKPPSPSKRRRG